MRCASLIAQILVRGKKLSSPAASPLVLRQVEIKIERQRLNRFIGVESRQPVDHLVVQPNFGLPGRRVIDNGDARTGRSGDASGSANGERHRVAFGIFLLSSVDVPLGALPAISADAANRWAGG